jgi:predicted outer membrane protein
MIVAALALGLTAAACDETENRTTVTGDGGTDASRSNLNQNQAIGLLMEANSGEIAEAQVAQARGQSAVVRAFAARMLADHQAANNQLTADIVGAGVIPADSSERQSLHSQTENQVQSLWSASQGEFDRKYISSQVNAHQNVLSMIDNKILPALTNTTLRNDVTNQRAAVLQHLQLAQSIQAMLGTVDAGVATGTGTDTDTGTGTGTGSSTGTGSGSATGIGTSTDTGTGTGGTGTGSSTGTGSGTGTGLSATGMTGG